MEKIRARKDRKDGKKGELGRGLLNGITFFRNSTHVVEPLRRQDLSS